MSHFSTPEQAALAAVQLTDDERSVRDAAKRVAHAGFVTCRLRSGYPNTDCERSKAAS